MTPRAITLKYHICPGDVLVLTAAVRSLHAAWPGWFLTGVDTSSMEVWENNPDIATADQLEAAGGAEVVAVRDPVIDHPTLGCNQRAIHYLQAYCDFLAHSLQVPVPLAVNRPLLYLSEEEKGWRGQVEEAGYKGKFWLINSGVKRDFTTKQYPWYQEVVNRLIGKIQFVQVGSAQHGHKPLKGVINFIGKTDLRQLIRLCHHAQGVVCGVSLLMHIAAAFEKASVVIAGGREPRSWNTYPSQLLLNNVGALSCCKTTACWRSRVMRLGDGDRSDQSLCEQPSLTDPPSGRCMSIISPEAVVSAIESYYNGGALAY